MTIVGTGAMDAHVRAVQELPAEAVALVQLATGVGPVVTVPGQVVVVQSLPAFGLLGTQVSAPTGPRPITGQVVAVHEFAALAGMGTQLLTGTPTETASRQLVVVKKLAAVAGPAEQLATPTSGGLLSAQVIVW